MTAISYHDTVNVLQELGLSAKGPFARPEWFALLQKAGHQPFLALANDDKSDACLPLMRGENGIEALTNWYAFNWTPLSRGLPTPKLFEDLARDLRKHTSAITFPKLAFETQQAKELEEGFRNAGWTVLKEASDTNHVLEVADRSYTDYLATRPGKLRTTLKRKAKKVEIVLKRQFDADDWAAYEAIYAESWKPEEGDPALLRQFAEQESDAGRYLFGIALSEGKPVAAQFWTVDGGAAYIHKLAHLESAKKISPGTTLTAALFEEVIDRDQVTMVDFGTGNDPYKADWMEDIRPRYTLTCLLASDPHNWSKLCKSLLRKLVS